ncbi:MAG TPA: SIS domain-containing protein, partial [Rhodanobacteraceae bacterium]|nr:SIS domain-containing protein [Rhodanobacteraceae bacterium]
TKAFTTQLVVLLAAAIAAGRARGTLSRAEEERLALAMIELPARINETLNMEEDYRRIAENTLAGARDVLYLGRGSSFPIALEGALKLKEISYIHAEAYPAGELKHGPLALVDENMPVIAVAPNDHLLEKLSSNLEEVRARGGRLYVLAADDVAARIPRSNGQTLALKASGELVAPVAFTIPLQLLAYHVAVLYGTDVDQPRNLAKSVTVE